MSIIENAAKRLEQVQAHLPDHADPQVNDASAPPEAIHGEAADQFSRVPGASGMDGGMFKLSATIDLDRLHEMGMVVTNGERTRVAEEFRVIKRALLRNVVGNSAATLGVRNSANLIMVTSSVPKEGKTFCAINLAMSLAIEKDYTVLLVDADVACPSVLRVLGINAEVGLMDLLQDEKRDVAESIIHTNIASLSIIPAGKSNRHATEMLASHTMAKLVAELAKRYPDRIVIFDSPPLLATTEAQVLASHMGQIVIVVEAESTTQHQLKEALRLVDDCSNIHLLYNKARRFPNEAAYGYY